MPGDTLWGIAERAFGDGLEWRAIVELNRGRTMSDGSVFTDPGDIRPGWRLWLPAAPDSDPGRTVEVAPGDSLSAIAVRELGAAARWPELYEENQGTIGPDPDLILPGEQLRVPLAGGFRPPKPPPPEESVEPEVHTHEKPPPHTGDAGTLLEGARPASPESTAGVRDRGPADQPSPETDPREQPPVTAVTPWRALLATGSCLAAGLLGLVVANRRRQLSARRPGRGIRPTPEHLRPLERAIYEVGRETEADLAFVDLSLRSLALRLHEVRQPLPELGAAVLAQDGLLLKLIGLPERPPPEPWSLDDDDTWFLPRTAVLPEVASDWVAPYPALVSTGLDTYQRLWLLDLEAHGGAGLDLPDGLLLHWVAELAASPWGSSVELLVADPTLASLAQLNPERVTMIAAELAARRRAALQRDAQGRFADLLALRRDGVVEDTTGPVVIVGAVAGTDGVTGRRRDRVVVLGDGQRQLLAQESGTWSVVDWDVPIEPFGLQSPGFEAISQLLGDTEDLSDDPTLDDSGVRLAGSATGGASSAEVGRLVDAWDEHSLLPAPSEAYVAANDGLTPEDLTRLAPRVGQQTRQDALALDPELDRDIADWADPGSLRPKIRVLGPVDVTAGSGSRAGIRNVGGTIEFIVYLAFSERGVTKDRAAEDLGWTGSTVQNRARDARRLMGLRPDGSDWLPDAAKSESARRRGVPSYQLHQDVLVDAHLLTRLGARARSSGADGVGDVTTALNLVKGEPFEQLRKGGYGWLLEGDRLDLQLSAAIDDLRLIRELRESA